MTETQALLAAYVREHSDSAFGELVKRYINLVYSTALRLTGGDAHLAEDQIIRVVFQRRGKRRICSSRGRTAAFA